MINSVSNVSFRGETASDWQTLIESEGQYTQKPTAPARPDTVELSTKKEKKGGAGKTIGGIVAGVVIAGLALFGLSRGNILKIDKEAKGLKKVGSWLAEAGEWIGKKCIDPIVNLFKGKGGKKAADAAGDAAKGAEKTAEKAAGDAAKGAEKTAEKAAGDAAKGAEKTAEKAADDAAKGAEKAGETASK